MLPSCLDADADVDVSKQWSRWKECCLLEGDVVGCREAKVVERLADFSVAVLEEGAFEEMARVPPSRGRKATHLPKAVLQHVTLNIDT